MRKSLVTGLGDRKYQAHVPGVIPVELRELSACKVPPLLRQRETILSTYDKVFSSDWITDNHIVMGTKCNSDILRCPILGSLFPCRTMARGAPGYFPPIAVSHQAMRTSTSSGSDHRDLMVLDSTNNRLMSIPTLHEDVVTPTSGSGNTPLSGIHSISQNPSGTLLATVSTNVAVYKSPSLDPVCLGIGSHTDCIFASVWLDDNHLVTGSRDGSMALWQPPFTSLETLINPITSLPCYDTISAVAWRECECSDKVRALAYDNRRCKIVSLSLNGLLHKWDAATFKQEFSLPLKHCRENVCLSYSQSFNIFASGSQSHISFHDPSSLHCIHSEPCTSRSSIVRSLSFHQHIVTVGTGRGQISFFDIRNRKYIECSCGKNCVLNAGSGWLCRDTVYHSYFPDNQYPNAIYTHAYDASGTKLFAAGGPLPAGLKGSYCAIWSC